MNVRVLIADDQELVRAGLRMILDAQPDIEVVGGGVGARAPPRRLPLRHPDAGGRRARGHA
jgi:DNA-binding NarL/FixJ family response regulator